MHWHGLRLENRYDGVPHDTQKPIAVGETFTYRVRFPDEGLYWYHPHIREDYTQDSGLYANIVVEPTDPGYWPACDREVVLTIDDVLIEEGQLAAYDRARSDHTAMGRFGNVFLVGGHPDWRLEVARGEVVRFFLTNTANTRVFNLASAGRAHEARRRRQRPLRARDLRRGRADRSLGASGRRRARSIVPERSSSNIGRRSARTPWAGSRWAKERRPRRPLPSTRSVAAPSSRRSARGCRTTSIASPTRCWRSSRRWTWSSRRPATGRRKGRASRVRWTPRSSPPNPTTARSAA